MAARAVNRARDLQNLPGNVATPEYLAGRAREIGEQFDNLEVEVFGRDAITEMGMGAFACVAQGTYAEPQMIVLRYTGGTNGPHLGFVGKAVTFDTGGISLKPGAKMSEMKFDMSGGAAVLEAVAAIAELGLPVTLTAVLGRHREHAQRPLGQARRHRDRDERQDDRDQQHRRRGAAGAGRHPALHDRAGRRAGGQPGHADRARSWSRWARPTAACSPTTTTGSPPVDAACTATGELGWRLPLHRETAKMVKGKYADLDNAPGGRKAGSITAAEFLKEFVGDTPWVHMDIAGTAWELNRPYVGNGASGFGVRTLIELARGSGA